MNKKPKTIRVITPPGVALFPHLETPDTEGEYANGRFKITIAYDDPTTLINALAPGLAEAIAQEYPDVDPESVLPPWRLPDEHQKEALAGKTILTATTKYQPSVVDKFGDEIERERVWSGDTVRVALTLGGYTKQADVKQGNRFIRMEIPGITGRLIAVQLVRKAAGGVDIKSLFSAIDDETTNSDVPF